MIVTLILNAIDYPESARAKEGDILAVCEYPHQGGRKTRKITLFVPVDMPVVTSQNDMRWLSLLKLRHYEDDRLNWPTIDEITGWTPRAIKKRRFCVPFATLDIAAKTAGITIDWKRVRNPEDDYQPLGKTPLPFSIGLLKDLADGSNVNAAKLRALKDANTL